MEPVIKIEEVNRKDADPKNELHGRKPDKPSVFLELPAFYIRWDSVGPYLEVKTNDQGGEYKIRLEQNLPGVETFGQLFTKGRDKK